MVRWLMCMFKRSVMGRLQSGSSHVYCEAMVESPEIS
jgi:hypothetical protein